MTLERQSGLRPGRKLSGERLEAIAQARSWSWPLLSAAVALVSATALAAAHRQIDFGTYLLGGAHAFQPDLYRVTYQPTGLGFTYPPFAAFWFVPLAHLPVRVAQVLFTWANLGALVVVLATSARVTCPHIGRRTVAWWSLLLLAPIGMLDPPRETMLLGQINILLVAAVIADMTLVRPGRRGVLVGLAAAIKLTPIILIPYLLLTRQVGAWRRAAGAFVGAASIAFIASPHASWSYWTHYVWNPSRAGGLAWVGNQGAVGVIERLVHHPLSSFVMFALAAVISGIGLVFAVRAHQRSWPVLGLLVVEATASLASPVSWSHHFVWVVLLIAWLALAPDRPVHGEWWAAAVAVLFWAAPFWWVPHGSDVAYAGRGWSIPLSDAFFLVLVTIPLATSWRIVRQRVRRSSPVGTMAPPDRRAHGADMWAGIPSAVRAGCGEIACRSEVIKGSTTQSVQAAEDAADLEAACRAATEGGLNVPHAEVLADLVADEVHPLSA